MKRLLHFSAILLMCVCAMSSQAAPAAGMAGSGGVDAVMLPMGSTSAFTSMYGVQSFNTQSLSMYGAQSQVMHGTYTVPMAAQSIGGGTTTVDDEEEQYYGRAHRALGGDTDHHPGYDQGDPFHTPLGEIPVLLLILLAALVTYLRVHKPVDYLRQPKPVEANDN